MTKEHNAVPLSKLQAKASQLFRRGHLTAPNRDAHTSRKRARLTPPRSRQANPRTKLNTPVFLPGDSTLPHILQIHNYPSPKPRSAGPRSLPKKAHFISGSAASRDLRGPELGSRPRGSHRPCPHRPQGRAPAGKIDDHLLVGALPKVPCHGAQRALIKKHQLAERAAERP